MGDGGAREKSVFIMISLKDRNDGFIYMGVGGRREKRVFIMISLQGEKDRKDGFICMGVGGTRENSVFILISLSRERRIEAMDSFLWEFGGEEKRVCLL